MSAELKKSALNPAASAYVPTPKRTDLPPPMVIMLVGPPGSGKTTLGKAIAQHYGFEFLCIGDKLRELRRVDPTLNANWGVKFCSSYANNLLDECFRAAQARGEKGVVIEYVKTPDGAVIVQETCRRHNMKVDLTLLLEISNVLELTSRIKSKVDGRKEDLNPRTLR
eukprot:NODE_10969_length_569_cov_57.677130_g10691_i0.p1 GENE.NODE_10969_length_569_cov_57.677130_g10691_i0~~NODE_10969_length_569_cov_57.677130_g10691_i0.p1  ORF type:complete len:167 (+),score=31.81 NODE_10969_length_569_cov_57.677130_g10691_i0:66-566(+)